MGVTASAARAIRQPKRRVDSAAEAPLCSTPGRTPPTTSPEIQSWLPELSVREKAALHHVLTTGAASPPIPVWRSKDGLLVLDDHERAELAHALDLPVTYEEHNFRSEDDARRFVLERNQARRSLQGLGRRYVNGALYNMAREPGRRTDLTSPHFEGKSGTAALKDRFGCSRATLERDGLLARQIDEAARVHGCIARSFLLDPRHRLTAQHIERFAALSVEEQDLVLEALSKGRVDERIRRVAPASPRHATAPNSEPSRSGIDSRGLLDSAVDALLGDLAEVERAAEAIAQSDPEADSILAERLNKIATGYATLQNKLEQLPGHRMPLGEPAASTMVVDSVETDAATQPLAGYAPHDWTRPAEEMSTNGLIGEIKARLGLADTLEAEGRPGIPLGLGVVEFVTIDQLRNRAADLEVELARRHSLVP